MEPRNTRPLPTLNRDIARKIVDHLDLSDICSISQSCKGFLEMSCGVSRLCCPLSSRFHPVEAYARLRQFLLRRCERGMELEELHLIGYACQTHPPQGCLVRLFHQLQQALAPALTTLILGNLRHLDIHNKNALLAGVSACSRLRHLVLCTWMAPTYWLEESGFESLPESTGYPKLDWGLVKALSEALPGLTALEFHTGDHPCFDYQPPAPVNTATDPEPGSWEPSPRYKKAGLPFDPDFVRSIVQSEAAGLQLLQVQRGYELAQEDFIHLPATLRYLSTPCSLSTDFSACKAIPNALEEATFLFTEDPNIMYTDEDAPVVAAAAWSLLSHMLLPSSTALRSLQESCVEREQRLLPDRPCCGELQLPKLSVLEAPLGIWSQICCNSIMQQQGPGWSDLRFLRLMDDRTFPTDNAIKSMLCFTSQLTALRSLSISLIKQWGYLPTLMEDFLWETVAHAPSLKNLIMTLAIQGDQVTADRELVELISCAEAACVGGAGTCGLEHLGIFLVHGESDGPPGPDMWLDCGIPMAYQQGAEGVCTAIGDLVQRRIFPALKEVVLCPVQHEKAELNVPDDFYSGLIESPFQAPHVMCRALVPDIDTMKKYEEAVYSRDCDDAEERACISRVLSHMYMHM